MLIPTVKNTKTITDLREDALGVLESASSQGLIYVMYRSQPKAVLLDIDEFYSLQEMLEDYLDIVDAKKLTKEPRGKGISLTELKKQYE